MAETPDPKSLQKTCFIYTVNMASVGMTSENTEEEIMCAFREHHDALSTFPNVSIVRAQIERNSKGNLHVNGGVKLSKVIRARTLENKAHLSYADPARNEDLVMTYGRKQETRVELLPNKGERKVNKSVVRNPKQEAIAMLLDGMNPVQICQKSPEVYFTHHRAIIETWKMMQMVAQQHQSDLMPLVGEGNEEE